MLGGAVAVILTGQISLGDALGAINPDVMIFLAGMFIVGEALVESGYLSMISCRFFSYARTPDQVIIFILFGMGFLSALLMNDTLAIIGTPLVLGLAAKLRISPKLVLLSLAIAITTGSVMSPIGNPQNLLVAVNSGMQTPFITFGAFLLVPTLISLGMAFLVLRFFFKGEFSGRPIAHGTAPAMRSGKNYAGEKFTGDTPPPRHNKHCRVSCRKCSHHPAPPDCGLRCGPGPGLLFTKG